MTAETDCEKATRVQENFSGQLPPIWILAREEQQD